MPQIFRGTASAAPVSAVPPDGREFWDRIAGDNAHEGGQAVRRKLEPPKLHLKPLPLDRVARQLQLGPASGDSAGVLLLLGLDEPAVPQLLVCVQRLLQHRLAHLPPL
jgi:hypothetical protein